MNTSARVRGRSFAGVDLLVAGAVAALGVLSLTLILVGDGNLGLAVTPLALSLLLLATAKAPLRHSLLVLGFLCLTLENPSEAFADRLWKSPLEPLGALLLGHLNLTIPVPALFFSGLDVALLLFTGIWVVRRINHSEVDLRGRVAAARPLPATALVCLGTTALVWVLGMAHEGFSFSNSLWQIFRVVYLPCVFLLFCAAGRGPEDARPLGVALLVAALVRAGLAIYLRFLFPDKEELSFATTHADSMLFADAFLLVVVLFFEQPIRKNLWLALVILPVLTWGMIANNRRLAWVELGMSLLVIYFITPMTRLKRRLAQTVALTIPLTLAYVAVGWSSGSGIFAPVRILRSVIDSKADTSTLWRDLENYNLYFTLRSNPLLGTGFGHEYVEMIHLPDISSGYSLYRYAPHNSILGLFAYSGFVGFTGIWLIVPIGMFFAIRCYRFATVPRDRAAALMAVGILVAYTVHCYGDMGLGTFTSVFTVSAVLALIAKQAVATGAWPLRPRTNETPPVAGVS